MPAISAKTPPVLFFLFSSHVATCRVRSAAFCWARTRMKKGNLPSIVVQLVIIKKLCVDVLSTDVWSPRRLSVARNQISNFFFCAPTGRQRNRNWIESANNSSLRCFCNLLDLYATASILLRVQMFFALLIAFFSPGQSYHQKWGKGLKKVWGGFLFRLFLVLFSPIQICTMSRWGGGTVISSRHLAFHFWFSLTGSFKELFIIVKKKLSTNSFIEEQQQQQLENAH